jgi:OFA family oxalate/formate antiporter-like MFS transporter
MTSAVSRLWPMLLATTLVNLPMGSLYAFSIFLAPLERSLGVGRSELAIVFATATISFTIGMNIAPRLYRLASAPTLIFGYCALSAAGLGLAAVADGLTLLLLGYGVLFGVGGGAVFIVLQQGTNLMVERRQGLVNGYVVSLYPAGAVIAAPLFGWGVRHWDVRMVMGGLGVVVAVVGVLATLLSLHARARLAEPESAATAASQAMPPARLFWRLWFVFFLAAAAGLTVLSQAAGIIAAYGASPEIALIATMAIPAAISAARLSGGFLVDRIAVPRVMAAAHLTALSGAIALSLWPEALVSTVTLAMIGVGYGLISGSTAGAIAMYWPKTEYGRIAGLLYIGWCVAAVTLPVLAGYLFDLTGGYRVAVIVAGCGNILGAALAFFMPASRNPRESS